MKKILWFRIAALIVAGSLWSAKNWSDVRTDYSPLRTDWAISITAFVGTWDTSLFLVPQSVTNKSD